MKLALTLLSLIVLTCCTASAQTTASSSNNEFIATFPVKVNFGMNSDGTFYSSRNDNLGNTITIIGSFRNAGGQTEYRINTESIQFSGDERLINMLPTGTAYAFIAQEVVIQGSLLKYTPVSTDCSVPYRAKVTAEACVTRRWEGIRTSITPCTIDQFSTWEFAVCAAAGDGTPSVTRIAYPNTTICSGAPGMACEPSCPTSDPSRLQ